MRLPLLLTMVALAARVQAAPLPAQFSHSGYVLDASDRPLDAASQSFSFTVFDAPTSGTQIWTATCSLPVSAGYYAAILGAPGCGPTIDANVLAGGAAYLQVALGGVIFTPRQTLTLVPVATLAREASHAADADALGGVAANLYQLKSDGIPWARLTGTPAFAAVATSGSYADLANKPTPATLGAEPAIAAGTAQQYRRGDKTWATLDTAAVPESGNLYFTQARALAATLTGYAPGAGTISPSDTILSAIAKLDAARANVNVQAAVTKTAVEGASCATDGVGRLATNAAGDLLVCDDSPTQLATTNCAAFGAGAITFGTDGSLYVCMN